MGVRTLINSENTIHGNSQDALKKKLANQNEVAKSIKEIPLKNGSKKNNGKKK